MIRLHSPEETGYLRGREAIDTARLVGLQVSYAATRSSDPADLAPEAAQDMVERGLWHPDWVVLDMTRLEFWDRWRAVWARIGAWYYIGRQVPTITTLLSDPDGLSLEGCGPS